MEQPMDSYFKRKKDLQNAAEDHVGKKKKKEDKKFAESKQPNKRNLKQPEVADPRKKKKKEDKKVVVSKQSKQKQTSKHSLEQLVTKNTLNGTPDKKGNHLFPVFPHLPFEIEISLLEDYILAITPNDNEKLKFEKWSEIANLIKVCKTWRDKILHWFGLCVIKYKRNSFFYRGINLKANFDYKVPPNVLILGSNVLDTLDYSALEPLTLLNKTTIRITSSVQDSVQRSKKFEITKLLFPTLNFNFYLKKEKFVLDLNLLPRVKELKLCFFGNPTTQKVVLKGCEYLKNFHMESLNIFSQVEISIDPDEPVDLFDKFFYTDKQLLTKILTIKVPPESYEEDLEDNLSIGCFPFIALLENIYQPEETIIKFPKTGSGNQPKIMKYIVPYHRGTNLVSFFSVNKVLICHANFHDETWVQKPQYYLSEPVHIRISSPNSVKNYDDDYKFIIKIV